MVTLQLNNQGQQITANNSPSFFGNAGDAVANAQKLINATELYVAELNAQVGQIFPPVIVPAFPDIGAPPTLEVANQPTLINVAWATPTPPLPLTQTLSLGNLLPPAFNGVQPTLNFGTAPAAFAGVIPPSPTVDLNFTYPTVALTLPQAPALMSISTVTFNPFTIPTFDITVPTLTLAAPNIQPFAEGALYTSRLLTDLQDDLDEAIQTGNLTTLNQAVQTALWDAAREREYRQQADALAALDRDIELLGFAYPPGVYLDGRLKIQTETNYTIAGLEREIMTTQAKLQLDNIWKAREQATALESKLIDYSNEVSQRAFDAAKYITEAGVSIYNAQVESYKASLDGYRTQAQVYQTQIDGIKAQIMQLQAQVEFEKTKASINDSLVNQYKAEVDASLAVLRIYETEVEIIKTQAEVEKIKVDVYGAQIQAFTGTVNAYSAQVGAYKAGIEAQATIEDAYKVSVEAYTAEVEAGVKTAEALIEEYKANIQAYTAQLEAYKAQLEAMTEQAKSAALYNESAVEVFKGEVTAIASFNQSRTTQWEAIIREQEAVTEVGVKAAEANGQLYISARQLSIDAAKTAASVMAQLGAAALSAIRWSNSSSWSNSNSYSNSVSTSTSTSTNNNFNESLSG